MRDVADHQPADVRTVLRKPPLLIFAGCVLLFHLANAAMLPLMGGVRHDAVERVGDGVDRGLHRRAAMIVALVSPWVGRHGAAMGRRPFLLAGFARAGDSAALLFAVVTDPYLLVAVQILDGITAAVLGVMVPLMIADITRGTGRFNLAQGIVGTAVGIGASISPTLAGYAADRLGTNIAFMGLAGVAATGLAMILLVMPETRRGAR